MSAPHVTTYAVKQRTVWAAIELLKRVGCDVVKEDTTAGVDLHVTIPPDAKDMHGERLKAARAEAQVSNASQTT